MLAVGRSTHYASKTERPNGRRDTGPSRVPSQPHTWNPAWSATLLPSPDAATFLIWKCSNASASEQPVCSVLHVARLRGVWSVMDVQFVFVGSHLREHLTCAVGVSVLLG